MPETWANSSPRVGGVDLHLHLDPGAAPGLRSALEHALRDAVRSGRLAAGTRLPATRTLAAELGLARGTVSAAYDQLTAEGYLHARVGSGTVVADVAPPHPPAPVPASDSATFRFDLRPGHPDVTTFPIAAWTRATRRALAAAPASAFGYGDPRGRIELRTALADYLARTRGVRATPEQIVITTGFVQALALLAAAVDGPVAMEDPGLVLHRDIVTRHGRAVVPLPVDDLGARTDLLSTQDYAGVRAALLTPAHQFPLGVTLHPQRRRAAVEWARAHHGLVVEDDYDGEFRYDRQPVGALQGVAPDHVVYAGTASKTLGPALRLGWLVLPPPLVDPVREVKRHTDWQTGTLDQLTLAELVTSHAYDRHVRSCRLRYRRRRDLLARRLRPGPRQRYTLAGVAAGLHTVITLPAGGLAEADVLAAAAARGLALDGLAAHRHRPGDHRQGVIVGFGAPGDANYAAAVDTLARVLREVA